MSIMSWNARGMGNKGTVRALKDAAFKYRPGIIFISETKKKKRYLEKIKMKMKLDSSFYVDPIGIAGGLALWWSHEVSLVILNSGKNFIDTKVSVEGEDDWLLTFIYGPPYASEKQVFWESLASLRTNISEKWCVIGDSNMVSRPEEKLGGAPFDASSAKWFYEFMDNFCLLELPLKGGTFTWSNQRCEDEAILEKLDRILISLEWSSFFPKAIGILDAAIASDHAPIFLLLKGMRKKIRKDFKFEAKWILEEGCKENVQDGWHSMNEANRFWNFTKNLSRTRRKLKQWRKLERGNNKVKEEEMKKRIKFLQGKPLSENEMEELKTLKKDLDKLWESEELYWHQRARINWLKAGDRNTKFFHATTLQNRRSNAILRLKNHNGEWIENEMNIVSLFYDHFREVYSKDGEVDATKLTEIIPAVISSDMNSKLCRNVLEDEVKEAVFNMGALKSPGPDGFPGLFYQQYWDTIKVDLVVMVTHFFDYGVLPEGINKTNIVLIPKRKNPTEVTHFRPISLCNFSLKIITKILASRLKKILPDIISPHQSAFVHGRLIQDNIIIAHEAFHAIKRRRKGSKGVLAMKVDMEKAYDKVDWDMLRLVLTQMGFCEWWVNRVMQCVSSVSFSIIINGEKHGEFLPERGLRQGDPLSPFLFLFVANIFSRLIEKEVEKKSFEGFKIKRRCPVLSHLMFADDCIVFTEANEVNCRSILNILNNFQKMTGQTINYCKSSVFFSSNLSLNHRQHLSNILGCDFMEDDSTYLGLPAIWGRSKKEALIFIKDRVRRKLQGWKAKFLSQAGKEILIKAVVQAIPSYVMQCFLLPATFCDELSSMIARFWWNNSNEKDRGIHWLNWKKLSLPKDRGGLGFRDLKLFNQALVTKMVWRMIKNPDSFLAQTLRGIYFPDGNIFAASACHNPSWAWLGIRKGIKTVAKGSLWRIGNGKRVSIWDDKWIPMLPSRSIISERPPNCQDVLVSKLISDDSREWIPEKLVHLFSPTEVEAILSIPIGGSMVKDVLIWAGSKDGEYTVKSGYHFLAKAEELEDSPSTSNSLSRSSQLWKSLWGLNVPPKIRSFLWNLCHNIVPTKATLFYRFHGSFKGDTQCPRCGKEEESIEHMLFLCPFAQATWRASSFNYSPSLVGFPGFSTWWEKFSKIQGSHHINDSCELAAFVCWYIWKSRNNLVFAGGRDTPVETWLLAERSFFELQSSMQRKETKEHRKFHDEGSWSLPPRGMLKVNVDAAFDKATNKAAVAAIARDVTGQIKGGDTMTLKASSASSAEAFAIRFGMNFALKKGFSNVIVESDNLGVVKRVKSNILSAWESASIEEDIVNMMWLSPSFSLIHTLRGCNRVADWMAKAALKGCCPNDWAKFLPVDIVSGCN